MEYKGNYAFINIKNEKKKSIKFQKIASIIHPALSVGKKEGESNAEVY